MDVATAHLVTTGDSSAVLGAAAGVLRERFSIAHATLQVEGPANPTCEGADW
jgi:cobalt-zinc-cadmium efflux system protein